jgi:threonine/homoserine/homoserine lactone efflux protein
MEHLAILFFATFSAAFMASAAPGLLNVNAAKMSVEKGKTNGYIFGIGVSTVVMVQALIAVFISKYLYTHPETIDWLQKIALLVFAFFAIYFFIKAKKGKAKPVKVVPVKKRSSFLKGMLLSAVNMLAIPFFSGVNAMWNASGWIKFKIGDILAFVLAAGCGTFAIMYLYVVYFNKLETRTNRFSKNSNYILSALMLVLLVITIFRILYT